MSENSRKHPDRHNAGQDDNQRKSLLYKDADGGTIAVSEADPLPVKIMNPEEIGGGTQSWAGTTW